MTVWTIVALLVGLVALVLGAELLVKGAAAVATRLGIQPVVIGLTVVAFGTSAPELAVSVGAALADEGDVAFGNVVGSNITNILMILGASAVVGGLAVSQRIVRLDIPLLILASVVALLLSLDNTPRPSRRCDPLRRHHRLHRLVDPRRPTGGSPTVAEEYADSIDAVEGADPRAPAPDPDRLYVDRRARRSS